MPLRFGLSLPFDCIENLTRQAKSAEVAGFDSLWFPDHVVSPGRVEHLEAWSVLSTLASVTTRVVLGPAVTDPFRRHPAFLTHSLLTLDNISRGRAFLGLGAGEPMNLTPFGIRVDEPLVHLREAVVVVRSLCSASASEPACFSGKKYTMSRAFLGIKPVQRPFPPIYLGALGPRTRQLAGEIADGWLPYVHSPKNYTKLVSDVKIGVEKAGRRLEELDLVANVPVCFTNGKKSEALRIWRRLGVRLILEGTTLRDLGWQVHYASSLTLRKMVVDPQVSKQLEELSDAIPHEITKEVAAIGTVSTVIDILDKYVKLGATHLLIRLLGDETEGDLAKFGTQVIQYFREG